MKLPHVPSFQISHQVDKQCKSYEQKNTLPRARGQEIGQVSCNHPIHGLLYDMMYRLYINLVHIDTTIIYDPCVCYLNILNNIFQPFM